MRVVAAELEDTDFHGPIASEATRVSLAADRLDGGIQAKLRLV